MLGNKKAILGSLLSMLVLSGSHATILPRVEERFLVTVYGSNVAVSVNLGTIKANSIPLSDEQRQKIQSYIDHLRALGFSQDADRLQAALNAGKIRIGDPSTMRGIAALTTDRGVLYINEAWLNETLKRPGGASLIEAMLLHESTHMMQFKDMWDFYMNLGYPDSFRYDQYLMEVDALDRHIAFLKAKLYFEQDPKVRASLQSEIDRLEKAKESYRDKVGRPELLTKPKPGQGYGTSLLYSTSATFRTTMETELSNENVDVDASETCVEILSKLDDVRKENGWAGWEESLPLYLLGQMVTYSGLVPDYDSRTWTNSQYTSSLGYSPASTDLDLFTSLRMRDVRVKTNPAVVGKTVAEIPSGVPLYIFSCSDSSLMPYGYDKHGNRVSLPVPPNDVD